MSILIPFFIGVLITVIMIIKKPTLMKADFSKIASFLAFMAIITVGRISFCSFMSSIDPTFLPQIPDALYNHPMWRFLLVFWEDAFFVLPMVFAFKYLKNWMAIPIVIGLSLWFGSGHLYQGWWAVIITSLYPYFISYKYGLKVGFGTVMLCHILYDFITTYTIMFMGYLI